MPIAQLVYVSKATTPQDEKTLKAIEAAAIRHNPQLGVTGVLVAGAGHYIQLLEGDPFQLSRLYETIRADRRHAEVRMLLYEPARDRTFPRWSMRLHNVDRHHATLDLSTFNAILSFANFASKKRIPTALVTMGLINEFVRVLEEAEEAPRAA